MNKLIVSLFIISILFVAGCSDDPQATNEEEVVTTVMITLTPEAGTVVTLSWDDLNDDAIVDESEIASSGALLANETYGASIQLLNKSVDPEIDITEEVAEEAEEHIFCFTVTGANIAITHTDEDKNGLPVGITSTWTTTTASTGAVTVTLRHQPGVKTGDCPGAGDTDVAITFAVEIQNPI